MSDLHVIIWLNKCILRVLLGSLERSFKYWGLTSGRVLGQPHTALYQPFCNHSIFENYFQVVVNIFKGHLQWLERTTLLANGLCCIMCQKLWRLVSISASRGAEVSYTASWLELWWHNWPAWLRALSTMNWKDFWTFLNPFECKCLFSANLTRCQLILTASQLISATQFYDLNYDDITDQHGLELSHCNELNRFLNIS